MRVTYEVRRNYPHMIGEEQEVWTRFINDNPEYFDEVEYDVRVGQGVNLPDDWNIKDQRWAQQLTQKRIDVIGYKDAEIVLVEVKLRVIIGTLGQVLGYKFLYEREQNLVNKTSQMVVAAFIGPDDYDVLEHYDVKIFSEKRF
ncbi:hypothetical protein LCGC14_0954830 [marine sediment metagenome]|uniref:Uncharacterized protein n=1 Tax=marine sediment metagenome TaxID=412755 RepID=A0A0F9NKR0_9ZZZZ|nr:hypothetical protein [bacterium]